MKRPSFREIRMAMVIRLEAIASKLEAIPSSWSDGHSPNVPLDLALMDPSSGSQRKADLTAVGDDETSN